MVGSGVKKLANEYGMTVSNGIAYGSLGGYAATMDEGSGWKRIVFSTRFADPAARAGIGVFALLRKTGKQVAGDKYVDLA